MDCDFLVCQFNTDGKCKYTKEDIEANGGCAIPLLSNLKWDYDDKECDHGENGTILYFH